MSHPPGILARGPWQADQVASRWREDTFEPPAARTEAADEAIAALEDRGSPAHDGLAARLADFRSDGGRLELELQPMRWSLRLVRDDASASLAALCVTRSADGRWLAGRRAPWVATWAGRWALGAGGAVEVGEDPVADAHARARGGVVGDAGAPDRRGARVACPTGWRCSSASRGCPTASRSRPTPSTTRTPGGRAIPPTGRSDADPALRRMASLLA